MTSNAQLMKTSTEPPQAIETLSASTLEHVVGGKFIPPPEVPVPPRTKDRPECPGCVEFY
jgi:hypothetical protein